jgi:hypothetical protein
MTGHRQAFEAPLFLLVDSAISLSLCRGERRDD